MTCHSEVARKVTAVRVEPYSAAGRPALTAIVTHKNGDLEPGSGFYQEARALGHQFEEPYIFWAEQVQAVFKRFAGGSIRRR